MTSLHLDAKVDPPRCTTTLRAELPRRVSLGSATMHMPAAVDLRRWQPTASPASGGEGRAGLWPVSLGGASTLGGTSEE